MIITFFNNGNGLLFAVESDHKFNREEVSKLTWLLAAKKVETDSVAGTFIGPRREMVTPWSTNAVEIAQNMSIAGITRIEQFEYTLNREPDYDPMLSAVYHTLDADVFKVDKQPDPIVFIDDLHRYNQQEGLALSEEEIDYLHGLSERLGRPLTDSEVFGFSQVNSEHCRHKIFNGTFIIGGKEMPMSLFSLIKKTSKDNPNRLVSAYKDNVAFVEGPVIEQFAPTAADRPSEFAVTDIQSVLSLKAETHNFPTTVEPFNGAATGTGGEIRDRLGGGRASLPLAGTAVYMTAYPRTEPGRPWEGRAMPPRNWHYQTPEQILIKASDGASDFGNKFGQPLICGSVLTYETVVNGLRTAYDKVIMLAGGVGFANARDAIKGQPQPGQQVIVMGGDNYRIGMGGGAVSSVNTGKYAGEIELNAVQRANPEMQKRVANVIRAMAEADNNPIVSIHDHGAGGHLNALSELVEEVGGHIDMAALPVGDPTLSAKEIIGNESQERMGMVVNDKDVDYMRRVAERERAPFYVVGQTTGDHRFVFEQADGKKPIDLAMADMFGSSPRTVMTDRVVNRRFHSFRADNDHLLDNLSEVLQLEAVACKDWLTNKVDRSVTGRIARQQCQGPLQLPLSDCGVVALDYTGTAGIATSIGHAPQAGLIKAEAGSQLAIAEALTNIVGANLKDGLRSVSLSANWMWPCRNEGEDARLYHAVEACSQLACELGINIPTGKDSLSMTQNYNKHKVIAPGTVIISAAGEVEDVKKTVSPVLQELPSKIIWIDFGGGDPALGGSALAQVEGTLGTYPPKVIAEKLAAAFNTVQEFVKNGQLLAAHDVSAGGLVTTLLEMCFANTHGGMDIDITPFNDPDTAKVLFAENPALVVQVSSREVRAVKQKLDNAKVRYFELGKPAAKRELIIRDINKERLTFPIDTLRETWYRSSYLLDRRQSGEKAAKKRFDNFAEQPLQITLPTGFTGKLADQGIAGHRHAPSGVKAAIIRDKGINGDREMAWSLYHAGFDVKDVHMTDLMTGRETLDDVQMIVFCGGFSNSDVLGSAKGWASGFVWNKTAHDTLMRFRQREDTLSLGICNGCQLMTELNLIAPELPERPLMTHNDSKKFESAFLGVTVPENNSVMLGSLSGSKLGIWVAHGEGKFVLPGDIADYHVVARYNYADYPGNPNGSPYGVAGIVSRDGRHLAMMPHLERAIYPWQCGWYPGTRSGDEVTPWFEAFVNARRWCEKHKAE